MLRYTNIGAATALLEIGSLRLLTDPSFDDPGRRYSAFPVLPGFASTKRASPAISAAEIGRIDAVLLSHDHHFDNLDDSGRALLPSAGRVLTTKPGARRLGGNSEGLRPFESTVLTGEGGERIKVTATPARHGPPGSKPLVGEVIGFSLAWDGQQNGELYISGDTVYFNGIEEIARRLKVSVAVLNLGAARFPASGPIRYTFDAAQGARAFRTLGARTLVPSHMEGWTHFSQPPEDARVALEQAGVGERVRWVAPGETAEIEV